MIKISENGSYSDPEAMLETHIYVRKCFWRMECRIQTQNQRS